MFLFEKQMYIILGIMGPLLPIREKVQETKDLIKFKINLQNLAQNSDRRVNFGLYQIIFAPSLIIRIITRPTTTVTQIYQF